MSRNPLWLLSFLLSAAVTAQAVTPYDLVIQGGRVMDPETGLDAVRNVGITAGRILRISAQPLTGTRTLDAQGLVVAPGFIDLHQHAQDDASSRLKALDGVTSGIEMEIGVPISAPSCSVNRGIP